MSQIATRRVYAVKQSRVFTNFMAVTNNKFSNMNYQDANENIEKQNPQMSSFITA